ncbi:uncharacterized protein TNCV_4468781 [Trichonephila clavipes]|nr:uncharacterized protein TNCV_4468781 [Trichonephila clavipes]
MGQSLSNHGPHVFYRRKIRRASRPGKQFNLVIDEEPLDNAFPVWSCIILLKYGCSQALKAGLILTGVQRVHRTWAAITRGGRSDEAHFWLNGDVNKQNGRIWSEANPQVYVETPLHPEKLTAWCALWAGGILLQKR